MRTPTLATLSTLLLCGAASAQTQLPAVEVRAGTTETVTVSCAKPDAVSREDVERVLSIEDADMTRALQKRFSAAVSDACTAGIAHILVKSDERGNLTWQKME